MLEHPDVAIGFFGSWAAQEGAIAQELPFWRRERAMAVLDQIFEFTPEFNGGIRCEIMTHVHWTGFGGDMLRDVLTDLEVVHSPGVASIRGEGLCSYLITRSYFESPPWCIYTFLRRGGEMLVQLSYQQRGGTINRSFTITSVPTSAG